MRWVDCNSFDEFVWSIKLRLLSFDFAAHGPYGGEQKQMHCRCVLHQFLHKMFLEWERMHVEGIWKACGIHWMHIECSGWEGIARVAAVWSFAKLQAFTGRLGASVCFFRLLLSGSFFAQMRKEGPQKMHRWIWSASTVGGSTKMAKATSASRSLFECSQQ